MFCWVLYHLKKVKKHVSKRGHEPKQQQEEESKEAGWQLTRKLGKARRPKTESETRESSNFQLSLRSHPTSVIAQQLSYWGGRAAVLRNKTSHISACWMSTLVVLRSPCLWPQTLPLLDSPACRCPPHTSLPPPPPPSPPPSPPSPPPRHCWQPRHEVQQQCTDLGLGLTCGSTEVNGKLDCEQKNKVLGRAKEKRNNTRIEGPLKPF